MLKILFLVTKSEMGGAQKYVCDLSQNLEGFDVFVAAGTEDGTLFKKLKVRNKELQYLKRIPKKPFSAIKEIKELLKDEKPDVLLISSTTAGVLGSIAARKLNIKVIYTVHGWAFLGPGFLRSKIFYIAEKLTAKYKDKFIVLSDYEKEIAKKITKPEKIQIIYNGIKSLEFLSKEEAKKELGLSPNEKYIGCIANLYKTKGLTYLDQTGLKNIVIIGEGPERKNLKNVTLLGRKDINAYKYLKAFDVYCLPSIKEGFPFSILEAMQAQIPIVATKVGALPEILDNECLVDARDVKALKEKLELFLQTGKVCKHKDFTFEEFLSKTKQCILSTLK